jgi:energy-coupling factor transporter ATP-binding protein EcfA2
MKGLMDKSLEVRGRGITRCFDDVVALDGIDLDVTQGQICGLVGPNGAGKTTLFGLLLGLAAADSGRLEILGTPVGRALAGPDGVAGFVDGSGLYPSLTARQNLAAQAALCSEVTILATGRVVCPGHLSKLVAENRELDYRLRTSNPQAARLQGVDTAGIRVVKDAGDVFASESRLGTRRHRLVALTSLTVIPLLLAGLARSSAVGGLLAFGNQPLAGLDGYLLTPGEAVKILLGSTATCNKGGGQLAMAGPGNDWRCVVSRNLPGVRATRTGHVPARRHPRWAVHRRWRWTEGSERLLPGAVPHRGGTEPAVAVRRQRRPAVHLPEGIVPCR